LEGLILNIALSFSERRRAFVLSTTAAVVLPFTFANSEAFAQSQIVDRSGSLRMLSQRMCKAYCQLGLGILPSDAETILARSLTRFNGALITLRENPASDKAIIGRIENDWARYRDLLSTTPTKQNFSKVDVLSESVLAGAEALTAQLAATLGIQSARLTNISGRQRMLSQRMAKSAFSLMWGMDARQYLPQHNTARDQFTAALAELKRAPQKTTQIAQGLDLAENQLGFFDVALGNRADLAKLAPARATNVARSNERLLEVFDELTAQFAALQG
jgi:Type IV pili methyl-accepting chemotaxis transducer N-term